MLISICYHAERGYYIYEMLLQTRPATLDLITVITTMHTSHCQRQTCCHTLTCATQILQPYIDSALSFNVVDKAP